MHTTEVRHGDLKWWKNSLFYLQVIDGGSKSSGFSAVILFLTESTGGRQNLTNERGHRETVPESKLKTVSCKECNISDCPDTT